MAQLPNDLTVYRDGDRYVVGRSVWQDCYSRTYMVADAYSRRELRAVVAEWAAKPLNEIEAAKRPTSTPDRFEDACDAGEFGVAWQ